MVTAMLARVILDFGTARLRATTVAIDDPGPLEQYLPEAGPSTAFVRRGEGFVGLGEIARFWWRRQAPLIRRERILPRSETNRRRVATSL